MARLADGMRETDFGVSLRSKLVEALGKTGYNWDKVKASLNYPRVIGWRLQPMGDRPNPFGVRILNKRTGQQFVHKSPDGAEAISAGEVRDNTRLDYQTGDTLQISHPAGCPAFAYSIRFDYEGEQSQIVKVQPLAPAEAPFIPTEPPCTLQTVVTNPEQWINFLPLADALTLYYTLSAFAFSISGSASVDWSTTTGLGPISVNSTQQAQRDVSDQVPRDPCSVSQDTAGASDGDSQSSDFDDISVSISGGATAILPFTRYVDSSDNLLGYGLPFSAVANIVAQAESSVLGNPFFQRRYHVGIGTLQLPAGATTGTTTIGGLTLQTFERFIQIDDMGDLDPGEEPDISASLSGFSFTGEFNLPPPQPSAGDTKDATREIVIPPPPDW